MTSRISHNQLYFGIAKLFAQRSTCLRGQVGCVIIDDKRVICSGYNGSIKGMPHCTPDNCNPDNPCGNTVHAEANAISYAAKNGISLEGTILYCTNEPCLNCAKLIIQAGIKEVNYIYNYHDHKGLRLLMAVGIQINQHILKG